MEWNWILFQPPSKLKSEMTSSSIKWMRGTTDLANEEIPLHPGDHGNIESPPPIPRNPSHLALKTKPRVQTLTEKGKLNHTLLIPQKTSDLATYLDPSPTAAQKYKLPVSHQLQKKNPPEGLPTPDSIDFGRKTTSEYVTSRDTGRYSRTRDQDQGSPFDHNIYGGKTISPTPNSYYVKRDQGNGRPMTAMPKPSRVTDFGKTSIYNPFVGGDLDDIKSQSGRQSLGNMERGNIVKSSKLSLGNVNMDRRLTVDSRPTTAVSRATPALVRNREHDKNLSDVRRSVTNPQSLSFFSATTSKKQ